jgi:hypothetical protein
MKLIKTAAWTTAFTAGLFLGGGSAARAQQPDRAIHQDQSKGGHDTDQIAITGELTRVDIQARTFSVKSAAGAEMLFRYDDKTIVTGAEGNVAGLATSSGSEVTVTYRNDSAGNMAAKIEIHGKR